MSCATVDWYRGQFSLKLCQVTVILKGTQKQWDLPALHRTENHSKPHLAITASLSVNGPCPSETVWVRLALTCSSFCLCLHSDGILSVSHRAHFLSTVPHDLVPNLLLFHINV